MENALFHVEYSLIFTGMIKILEEILFLSNNYDEKNFNDIK